MKERTIGKELDELKRQSTSSAKEPLTGSKLKPFDLESSRSDNKSSSISKDTNRKRVELSVLKFNNKFVVVDLH